MTLVNKARASAVFYFEINPFTGLVDSWYYIELSTHVLVLVLHSLRILSRSIDPPNPSFLRAIVCQRLCEEHHSQEPGILHRH